jgi:hypothetical protein
MDIWMYKSSEWYLIIAKQKHIQQFCTYVSETDSQEI